MLLFIFEAVSILFSQYRANSLRTFSAVALAFVAYFLVRLLVRKSWHSTAIAVLVGRVAHPFSLLFAELLVEGVGHPQAEFFVKDCSP